MRKQDFRIILDSRFRSFVIATNYAKVLAKDFCPAREICSFAGGTLYGRGVYVLFIDLPI